LQKEEPDGNSFQLAVLYVDMRSSTVTARKLDTKQLRVYYKSFLDEMISIVEDFGGTAFKTVGDCVIGFFPLSDGFQWADNVIRCGLTMIEVVNKNLSPFLKGKGLPELACRVGADFGEAQIINLDSKKLAFNVEVVGSVMNVAAKVQSQAGTNQIFIGHNLARLICTDYRQNCERKEMKIGEETYIAYHVNIQLG
jgi:class 3 adenylate cyclase